MILLVLLVATGHPAAQAQEFTEIETNLPDASGGSVAWGDDDGDGDLDVVVTGFFFSNQPFSHLFRNDS